MAEPAEAPAVLVVQESRRIQRIAKFAGDMLLQTQRDLGLGSEAALLASPRPLQEHMERLTSLIGQCRRVVDDVPYLAPVDGLIKLQEAPHQDLLLAQKAFMAAVATYRKTGRIARPGPLVGGGRAPTAPLGGAVGGVLGKLQAATRPLIVKPEGPPPQRPRSLQEQRRQLETVVGFADRVLAYTSPRLHAVESAIGTVERHAGKNVALMQLFRIAAAEAEEAAVPPATRMFVPRLVRLTLEHPTARRFEKQALGQWQTARERRRAARRTLEHTTLAPGADEAARVGSAVLPLMHLPTTFADLPVLAELFPHVRIKAAQWEDMRNELTALAAPAAQNPATARLSTAPLPGAPPRQELPETENQASTERLSQIVAYVKNPNADPRFADPTLIFRLVSEEHLFQRKRLADAQERLVYLPPTPTPDRQAWSEEVVAASKRLGQMQALLDRLSNELKQRRG